MPPTALIESIASVRSRVRRLSVVYGVGVAIAAAAGLLAAVVGVDYLLNLYAWPRVLLILVAFAAAGYCLWRFVLKPATATLTLSDIAAKLERAFPQFEDRLRSTINFIETKNAGSDVLQQRTIEQATRLAGEVRLPDAVVARPAITSAGVAAGAVVAVLLVAMLLDRGTLAIIAARLVTPFAAPAWPKRVRIELASNVPTRVAAGQKIDVRMSLARGFKPSLKPILYYQLDNGPVQQLFMAHGDGTAFGSSLDARLEPGQSGGTMRVWVEAGDDKQELPPVAIVPRLTIRSITARITPPAYAKNRPTQTQDLATGPAVAAEGSGIAIEVGFNKPLGDVPPMLERVGEPAATQPATQPAPQWHRPNAAQAVGEFAASTSQRFRVKAVDADGFSNAALEEYELVVRPDTNLSIQLEQPRRSEQRTATAFVPLQAVAEDDCGIAGVSLVVERFAPSPQKWTVPLVAGAKPTAGVAWQDIDATPDRVRSRLNYKWELAPLKLNAGDVIEYGLVAQDNYELDGTRHPPVGTPKLRITIVSQEELAARVTDDLRSIRTQAGLVRGTQQRARQDTQQLAQDTKDKPRLDAGDQAVAQRLTQQQASSAAAAKQLGDRVQQSIDRLEENRATADDLKNTAGEVRDTLRQTGEGPMKAAAQKLADAGQQQRAADERQKDLTDADGQQQKALSQLDRALSKLDSVGSLQGSISEMGAILSEQQQLRQANEDFAKANRGKPAAELADAEKQKLDAIAERQDKLADRTQKALDAMTKQAEQMKQSDPAASEAMAAAAKQGEQGKVSPDQKRAAQQTSQNQQGNAQQTQKQVELGLEQVLGELKEAQKRELARLQEKLAQLQEQVATLIRRQSGHNLDSLMLQGGETLKAAGPKVLAGLTTDAGRDPKDVKPPTPQLLTAGEELTGRNTRDLANSTDTQPQTAEVGSRLGRAAGEMDRAVVGLRASDLAVAYAPHQVDALAALVEARDLLIKQKEEADKKQQEQQKDAVRARYVKLLERQQVINADTLRIDKSRDAAGNLRRVESLQAAGLSTKQTGVAADTAKMEEDLNALGSVVYVWANRDIQHAMEGVQKDLAATKTAIATQAEQSRIAEELTAMIKNLEEKPPEPKKFENAANGGQQGQQGKGQQQGPKMPTEIELKLLKSLQQAVNASTTKIAAAPNPDGERLISLGGRQGDLRNLLDNLLKKASQGKMQLEAEPENKDQLPEETAAAADANDLGAELLGEAPAKQQAKVDKDFRVIGTRMARSRQRLAINTDAGQVTQEVQKRILQDLDGLIDVAHKNDQQQQQQQQASGQQKPQQPKPGEQQANNQGQSQGGQNNTSNANTEVNKAAAGSKPKDLKDLAESASEWGAVTPRVRQAVIDSRGEAIVEQYRKLIEDYYGALSNQGGKKQ